MKQQKKGTEKGGRFIFSQRRVIIKIREEKKEDNADIRKITEQAFKDVPHSDKAEPLIIDALRESGDLTLSLVAEIDNHIVGHVAVSPVSISDGAEGWYGLGPISVIPREQRKGIGAELMNKALSELKAMGAAGCVLLGDPHFYSRFGFKADESLVFPGVPAEYFQSLVFRGDLPAGEVKYHVSFYQ